MFTIEFGEEGKIIVGGRLDASQCEKAQAFLDQVTTPCVLDFSGLDYISSAGLGVLLKTQKRLVGAAGSGLTITGVNKHIHDIFRYSGFDKIFTMDLPAA